MSNTKHKFDENVEGHIASIVVDGEYEIARRNKSVENADFESMIDMLEGERTEKEYEWMSDISINDFASHLITDAASWSDQYFQTRDFVEVKLEENTPENQQRIKGVKKLINKSLNIRDIHFYHKYIRGRMINSIGGQVYALCWWEQETKQAITGYTPTYDVVGDGQIIQTGEKPIYGTTVIRDRFNFDILDSRNVFTDNTYSYSMQDKEWITIRSEKSYEELKSEAETNNYFNLDVLKDQIYGDGQNVPTNSETDTSRETYNKDDQQQKASKPITQKLDVLERFGKMWCKVISRDQDGHPTDIEPGYDITGKLIDDGELIETITTFVYMSKTQRVLIRFQPTPFRTSTGEPYKPIIRGVCYIHPTKDTGLSDGKNMKEMQVAINDTYNISMDRVKLATLPVLKGRKYSLEDNTTVYIEPEHVIELEDTNDLEELQISDDITGALNQLSILWNKTDQITGIYPTTMGDVPGRASTTATAVAGAAGQGTMRTNFKSQTINHTFLTELYSMILQMAYQFMRPETALKIMGEEAYTFDPEADYTFTPLSQNIETEYGKYRKIQLIDGFISRVAAIPNPKTPALVNFLLKKAFELFGDEFPQYQQHLLDENYMPPEQGGAGIPGAQMTGGQTSNQSGVAMSGLEQETRGI